MNLKSPITNKKYLLTNRTRINLLSRMFGFKNSSSKIVKEKIPSINYSNPIIRFVEMDKEEILLKEDIELIDL